MSLYIRKNLFDLLNALVAVLCHNSKKLIFPQNCKDPEQRGLNIHLAHYIICNAAPGHPEFLRPVFVKNHQDLFEILAYFPKDSISWKNLPRKKQTSVLDRLEQFHLRRIIRFKTQDSRMKHDRILSRLL